MTTEKQLPATSLAINSMESLKQIAKVLSTSGVFGTTGKAEQDLALAATKILAGQEMGLPPFASMRHIHLVKGKTQIGYQLVAKMIRDSKRYDYKVKRLDENGCDLQFTEHGVIIGNYGFSKDDAAKAGLLNNENYKKFPRQMYFARAITGGANIYCPDVFGSGIEADDVQEATHVTVSEPVAVTTDQPPALPPPIEEEPTEVEPQPQPTAEPPAEGDAPW